MNIHFTEMSELQYAKEALELIDEMEKRITALLNSKSEQLRANANKLRRRFQVDRSFE